jgi:hypothetical protein
MAKDLLHNPAAVPMSSVNVPLSEVAQQQLRRRASERGVPLEEFARTVLEREATSPTADLSAETWVAEWRAWAAGHPMRDLSVDDSRDSIYEGCGE